MYALNFKTKMVTSLFSPLIVSGLLISSPLMAESDSSLSLTAEQHSSLGLTTQMAQPVSQFPSANFPAEAMIPLKTIRTLSSPLSGMMTALNVVHGPIEKGQVLAEIESAALLSLQAELLATIADLNVANSELKRAKLLGKSGVSSTKNLQLAQAQVSKLKAVSAQQQQTLLMAGMAETTLNKLLSTQALQSATLQIVSPIEGQLYDLQVRLGERVNQSQALFSLGETDPIVLVVRVPVSFSEQLEEGQMARIPSLNKMGVIEHVDPAVDSMTQSVDVHVKVENSAHKIRPGQLFELHFLMNATGEQQALYEVPSNAISLFEGETVVFIKHNNDIKPLGIDVMNITQQRLYFTAKQASQTGFSVFVKGSTAIKSAFESSKVEG
jgi:cobalt-zinc-cadmium efflux system membrane fusion protein